ncbi:hypothetical protein [Winogradskyella aurantiaca]|uniref:hypothetical protein n=1 Tax=Winogradskyella aurantiaca TaxID=2219558 RepID=UPI000E1CBFF0|nr:hypothetical protein [Winogradskyella aurantiaca]
MGIAQESHVNEDSIIQQLQIRERVTYSLNPRTNDSTLSAIRFYNSKGQKIEDQYFNFNRLMSSKFQYRYNADGLLVAIKEFKDGKIRARSNYIYSEGLHKETLRTSLDETLRKHQKFIYNADGLLHETYVKAFDDNKFVLTQRRSYDNKERLIKIEYYKKNGKLDYSHLHVYDARNVQKVYRVKTTANRLERIITYNSLGQRTDISYLKSNRRTSYKFNEYNLPTFNITYLSQQLNSISKFNYSQMRSDYELFEVRKLQSQVYEAFQNNRHNSTYSIIFLLSSKKGKNA